MNNYNTNWLFQPPNLFGMRRPPNRNGNQNQNVSQPAQYTKENPNAGMSEKNQRADKADPENCDALGHGPPTPVPLLRSFPIPARDEKWVLKPNFL